MRSRVIAMTAVFLLLVLAVGLTACDDLTDTTTTSVSTTTEGSSTTTTEKPDTTTTVKPSTTKAPKVEVPDLYMEFESDARSQLAALGLVASSSYMSSTGSMDYGLVIVQDPAAGSMVAAGSTVNITVHGTGQKAEVPDLIGMTEGDAELACFAEYLHCHANYVTGKPPGIVFGQTPAAGALLEEGKSVTIDVGI